MILKKILRIGVLLLPQVLFGAGVYAQNYGLPLDVKNFQTSSGFGKLRGTRFHAGIDLRTDGVEGKKVLAVDDGYISRIGVKPYGYGNVLYLTHPDGRTSVYGHLSKFNDDVAAYVKAESYRLKQSSPDLYPTKNKFSVKKGDIIGLSGNTGSSSGPHLHFEIREANGKVINIMSRGYYNIKDNIPPQIFNLYYYTVDTLLGIPVHTRVAKIPVKKNSDGKYAVNGDVKLPGRGYFEVETMDRKNDVAGGMTTYRIVIRADGRPVVEYVMDGLSYDQNHWAKIIADYNNNRNSSNDVFRLAVINDGVMPFYRNVVNKGLIDPSQTGEITVEVADDAGNVSVLSFPVLYDTSLAPATITVPTNAATVYVDSHYSNTTDSLKVTIPAGALYEPLFYTQGRMAKAPDVKKSSGTMILSGFYNVHRDDVPLRSPVTLSFRVDVPEELRSKVVLARVNGSGRLAASPAKYADGNVTGNASLFGVWCVAADTTKPFINPLFKDGDDMSDDKFLSFRIGDDFSGLASFSVEVDGKWVLLQHNAMKGVVYHYFDDAISGTGKTHAVAVTAKDAVGNTAQYKGTYYR